MGSSLTTISVGAAAAASVTATAQGTQQEEFLLMAREQEMKFPIIGFDHPKQAW